MTTDERETLVEDIARLRGSKETTPVGTIVSRIRSGALDSVVDVARAKRYPDHRLLALTAGTPHVEVARALLDRGAALENPPGHEAATPLLMAVVGGPFEMVEYLLAQGADPNARNRIGLTPLHFAAMEHQLSMVRALLAAGGNPLAVSDLGETPITIPRVPPHVRGDGRDAPEIMRLLREASEPFARELKGKALVCRRRKHMLIPSAGGCRTMLDDFVPYELKWAFVAVAAPAGDVAEMLAEDVRAARIAPDAAKSKVKDGAEVFFVVRWRGNRWALIPLLTGVPTAFDYTPHRELGRRLAERSGHEVVACQVNDVQAYNGNKLVEQRTFHVDLEVRDRAAEEDFDRFFVERGILVPPCTYGTDGYHAQFIVPGLRQADVERLDVIVAQEWE